jgi:ribosomal protein S18 acetylase RimI-like enzyme
MNPSPAHVATCTVFTASDGDEMARLLGNAFVQRDPPAVAAGLTTSEFEAFVGLYCAKASAEGLTIVARSAETGEMCGALLAEDSAGPLPPGIEHLSKKFNPIFDLLGQLEEEYRSGRAGPSAGESIHVFLVGVSQRFTGMGIAQQLVAECLANGARKGYRVAVTEATSRTSQHVFRKLGFAERVRRSYREHRYQGQHVFASITAHDGPILMDKPLSMPV